MSVLDKIVEEKREAVLREKKRAPLEELKASLGALPSPLGFAAVLKKAPVHRIIAEIKRASPSKGIISREFNPREIACAYAAGGAACLSILTEENHFQGQLSHIREAKSALVEKKLPSLPVLRKDFIVDSYQVWESRAAGADAILLIVGILDDAKLAELARQAMKLSLDVLIEVHDETEAHRALDCLKKLTGQNKPSPGSFLLGINNRDLNTFITDLSVTQRLSAIVRSELARDSSLSQILLVSESGIASRADLELLTASGADAFLVGESLLRTGSPSESLQKLMQG